MKISPHPYIIPHFYTLCVADNGTDLILGNGEIEDDVFCSEDRLHIDIHDDLSLCCGLVGVVGAIAGSIIGESIAQNIDFDEIKYKFGIY